MPAAILPGQYLSATWWLWASCGVACPLFFMAVWLYYLRLAPERQITNFMAIIWATIVTLPGLVFAAGALWWIIDVVRSASL